jgi:hypothetical protein
MIKTITCKCTAEETLKVYAFNTEENTVLSMQHNNFLPATEVEIDSDVIYFFSCECCEQVILAFREGPCMPPTKYATVTFEGENNC